MTIFNRYVLVTVAVVFLALFSPIPPAHALEPASSYQPQGKPANLTIDPLKPFPLGDHPVINLHLTAQYGQPIPNQPIIILVDGARKAEGRTDSRGLASIILRYKFPAGTFHIKAIYPGI